MKQVDDTADDRQKSWCIHCGQWATQVATNRDHAPSKTLLDLPLPANVPVVQICQPCNSSFAPDEEYLSAFMGAVLCGSADPESQVIERSARILQKNLKLRKLIEAAKRVEQTPSGDEVVSWQPEHSRIERILVKNARGHAFFELSEPMIDAPSNIWFGPLSALSDEQIAAFEDVSWPMGIWPEVGSRMMTRLLGGQDLDDGWVIVQEGVYRYAVLQTGKTTVRIIVREYLAAEISWEDI